ncbi:mycofactocin system transcriptional regulator MftR2 [Nocardia sp. CNY236]|uniref:mycofactocin system transcriptional regulator MftR2 n=1 Tax=Nocardia sp. CNY236 TaxID=1169152 RepID=UPI000420A428|nr:mycofactocin system transcriptional regulator MftR2 [Nocardia sp. CNY236]
MQTNGGGGTLSESEIVEAALRVVREDGVEKLSMRRLSRELGVSPMAPYYYVADKRELLDLVASAALSGVRTPPPESRSWQFRLRDLVDQIDERLRKHPGLGDILIEQMPGKQLDLIAAIMDVLAEAGFSDRDVLAAYATIHTYLFGRSRVNPRDRATPAGVALPPIVERATRYAVDLRGRYSYDFGMDVLIAGLEARLVRRTTSDVR